MCLSDGAVRLIRQYCKSVEGSEGQHTRHCRSWTSPTTQKLPRIGPSLALIPASPYKAPASTCSPRSRSESRGHGRGHGQGHSHAVSSRSRSWSQCETCSSTRPDCQSQTIRAHRRKPFFAGDREAEEDGRVNIAEDVGGLLHIFQSIVREVLLQHQRHVCSVFRRPAGHDAAVSIAEQSHSRVMDGDRGGACKQHHSPMDRAGMLKALSEAAVWVKERQARLIAWMPSSVRAQYCLMMPTVPRGVRCGHTSSRAARRRPRRQTACTTASRAACTASRTSSQWHSDTRASAWETVNCGCSQRATCCDVLSAIPSNADARCESMTETLAAGLAIAAS